jgi:hypothetical protein
MEVSISFMPLMLNPPGKQLLVHTVQECGWAPELVSALQRKGKSLAPSRNQTPRLSSPLLTSEVYIFHVLISPAVGHQITQTFKIVTAECNFIIVTLFLKFNISVMCQNNATRSLKNQLSDFIYLYFNLYSHHIKVHIFISKILYFWLYIQKVHNCCHSHAFISLPNVWPQRYVWLVHIQYMQSSQASIV